MVKVHSSTDTSVQQDDKGRTQSREEEVKLGTVRLLLGEKRANATDQIEHRERGETKGSVKLGVWEEAKSIDNDSVGSSSAVGDLDAHKLGDLTGGNVDGGASHEGANSRQRDELDEPAKTCETEEGNYGTSNDCKSRGDDMSGNIRDTFGGSKDDVASNLGHNGNGLVYKN